MSTPRGAAWTRRSIEVRRLQPWCSFCRSRDDLTVDHIVPVSDLDVVVLAVQLRAPIAVMVYGGRIGA